MASVALAFACANPDPEPATTAEGVYPATYTQAQIAYDFGIFRAALEEAHPGLYRYRSKEQIDAVFAQAAASLESVHSEGDLYLVLGRVVAAIGDGHTRLRLSAGHEAYLNGRPTFLPFKLRLIERRAYLWRDYSEDRANLIGSEIVAMNGMPMDQVLSGMLGFFSSDGTNVTGKYKDLEGTLMFGLLYQLVHGPTEAFELELRPAGADSIVTATVAAVSESVIDQRYEERYAEDQRDNLELTMIEGSPRIAVIRISGFFGDDYEQFLAGAFSRIGAQGVEHLILDLRDNGGGRDMYGSMLLSYLTDEPFAYYHSLQINGPEFEIMKFSQNPSYSVPEEEFELRDDGYYLTPAAHDNLNIQQPREPHFDGAVYALISGASFSATSEFLAGLYQNRDAVYIGEESGGGQYGNTSGSTAVITLPHTKMRVNVPLIRYNSAIEGYEPTDRGMIPDHEVYLTQQDVLDGSDSVLEFTLELIRQSED